MAERETLPISWECGSTVFLAESICWDFEDTRTAIYFSFDEAG